MDDATTNRAYEEGQRDGYRRGEMERIALATHNSNLRSDLNDLQQQLKAAHKETKTQTTWAGMLANIHCYCQHNTTCTPCAYREHQRKKHNTHDNP